MELWATELMDVGLPPRVSTRSFLLPQLKELTDGVRRVAGVVVVDEDQHLGAGRDLS